MNDSTTPPTVLAGEVNLNERIYEADKPEIVLVVARKQDDSIVGHILCHPDGPHMLHRPVTILNETPVVITNWPDPD